MKQEPLVDTHYFDARGSFDGSLSESNEDLLYDGVFATRSTNAIAVHVKTLPSAADLGIL